MTTLRRVSLADWRSGAPDRRQRFASELGAGLEETGFALLIDPHLPDGLLARAYRAAADLFALPEPQKRAGERPAIARQRGFTPFGLEHAKDQVAADLKEFWQVGRSVARDPLPTNVPVPAPLDPSAFDALFEVLEGVAIDLLDAVALHLELSPGTFRDLTANGNSVLRVIHYPPLPAGAPLGAVRAAAHEDINLMTVLPASTDAGLELLTHDGRWVAIDPPPGALIVDSGDMMALLTGGRLPATTHRVVNPTDPERAARARYSLPFFVHPRPDARLTPFEGGEPGPTAADFLRDRLIAIGVGAA
jgi:isopenicillin N synthase-like dioxygenase